MKPSTKRSVKIASNVSITLGGKTWPKCYIEATTYARDPDRIAILIMDADGPIATATVNLPEAPCPIDEVYIKDYSENEGMADFLIRERIIEPRITGYVTSGFVHISRYKLTPRTIARVKHLIMED